MKLLLDTHIFLWFISGDKRLTPAMTSAIRDVNNEVFLSAASIWEVIVKWQLGKLPLPNAPQEYLLQQRANHQIAPLAIDEETIRFLPELPLYHRDPFDRILVCQALQHDLTFVTADPAIKAYTIATLS